MLKALATKNEGLTPVRGAHSTPIPVLMALAAENKGITPVRGAYSTPTPRPIAQAMEDSTRHKVKGTYRYWNKMCERKYEFFFELDIM